MKKTLISLLCVYAFALNTNAQQHCDPKKPLIEQSNAKPNKIGGYGKEISKDQAIAMDALMNTMKDGKTKQVKITGKVVDVCKTKGCWMAIDKGNGESMRITFKDYAFFVPKDIAGNTVFAQGKAYYDTTSVEMLKHYAHDAKKPQAEIDKITKPEIELTFQAEGVLFEKK